MALACPACSPRHPRSPLACWKGASVNIAKKPLDKHTFVCYIITMKEMMEKESIFQVTFTNHSTVFVKAFDHEHAMRIVQNAGGLWTSGEREVEMVIDKIEKV